MDLEASAVELRRMEEVGRSAAEVAHDLRNVLTAILGFSTLVLEKARDPETRANAAEIVRAGERAASLSMRLLSIGRDGFPNPRPLDLHRFLGDLEPVLRRLVRDQVSVHVHLAGEALHVGISDARLEQVILNLVANASDATAAGGSVFLRTAPRDVKTGETISGFPVSPGSYAEITISDTGRGMDTATLARAFEPFFTTKLHGEGSGLGLSTAYWIVRNSKGYLWLVSSPEEGTTATLVLPRAAPGG